MEIVPIQGIYGTIPAVFMEARMHGQPDAVLVAHLGLSLDSDCCSVAVFARTSGVLFVAGVGSYVAYRMFARLLGRNFIWTIVDHARVDLLSRADVRLLHPLSVNRTSSDDLYSSVFADDEYSDSHSENGFSSRTENTFLSPESSPLRPFGRSPRMPLTSSHPLCSTPLDVKRVSKFAISEDGYIDRRKRDRPCERYRIQSRRLSAVSARSESIASRGLSQISADASERSASLRLMWDEPEWDHQMDFPGQDVFRRGQCPSTSNVSEMSEFKAAINLFDESGSVKEGDKTFAGDNLDIFSVGDDANDSMFGTHELIQRSCMTDSKQLYRIVPGCMTSSDAVSLCSVRTTNSFLSLRQHAASSDTSCGLLELTHWAGSVRPSDELFTNPMTDSGVSKGTTSTFNSRGRPLIRSVMLDSAIGTDVISSEDEAYTISPCEGAQKGFSDVSYPGNCIIRRTGLNLITEDQMSISLSERSLEWYEDEFNNSTLREDNTKEVTVRPELNKSHIGIDQLHNLTTGASTSVQVHPKGAEQVEAFDHEFASKCESFSPRSSPCIPGTREMMIWAREMFSADSAQFKFLHTLYSRRRLKRIGIKRSENESEHFILSFLHSLFYYKINILHCSNFEDISEALSDAFSKYDCLKQWKYPENVVRHLSSSQKKDMAVEIVKRCWNWKHGSFDLELRDSTDCFVEALKLAVMLHVIEAFERFYDDRMPRLHVLYESLFGKNDFREIMERLNRGIIEEELALLADTFNLRIEVLELRRTLCDEQPLVTVYPDNEYKYNNLLTLIKLDKFLYPAYRILD